MCFGKRHASFTKRLKGFTERHDVNAKRITPFRSGFTMLRLVIDSRFTLGERLLQSSTRDAH